MNRPSYTVLYSLFVIALFFGTSAIYQACGKNSQKEPEESLAEKVEEVADNYTEEEFFEDDETPKDEEDNLFQEEEESYTPTPAQAQEDQSSAPSYRTSRAASATGDFLVIAGNYLLENNADEMVRRLRSAGYSQAQKVVFDLSQYYTVIAGRYESRTLASSISSELNGKGIDNYVLRRKD